MSILNDIFKRRSLRRRASTTSTGIVPLGSIKSAAVVIDVEDNEYDECKEMILNYFKKVGIPVDIFYFDFRKLDEKERLITSITNTILKKDLNWYRKPSLEKTMFLKDGGGELFISLINNADFPIEWMAKCSPAKFKIGRKQVDGNTFDLVIADSPEESYTQKQAFMEIVRMLDKIEGKA